MKSPVFAFAFAFAAALALAAPSQAEESHAIHVQDADVQVFVREVARIADVTMIVDPRVSGSFSVSAEGLTREALLDLFVTTLKSQGVAARPSVGGAYRVFPLSDLNRRSTVLTVLPSAAEAQSL